MASTILVALYLRASTDEQTESIPAQLMLLERYAKDHNMKIVAIYQDQGKSGDSFQCRDGLQHLLADAKAGKFQQVLVRNLSRLSRRNSLKTAAPIIGPRTFEQVEDNLGAVNVALDTTDFERIDALVPPYSAAVRYYDEAAAADFRPHGHRSVV